MDTVAAAIAALPPPKQDDSFYAWFYKFANLELYNIKNLVATKFGPPQISSSESITVSHEVSNNVPKT